MNTESSLQFVAYSMHQDVANLPAVLEWMKANGSSVDLSWSEDTDAWECSWITGGIRFTGCQKDLRLATSEPLTKAFAHFVQHVPNPQEESVTEALVTALRTAINSVECASINLKTGEELPWYRQAISAIARAKGMVRSISMLQEEL